MSVRVDMVEVIKRAFPDDDALGHSSNVGADQGV